MEKAIKDVQKQKSHYELKLSVDKASERLSIHGIAPPNDNKTRTVIVQSLRYMPKSTVSITRGENRGRTLDYHNVAYDLQTLRQWDSVDDFHAEISLDGRQDPVVVMLQYKDTGEIAAVAMIDVP